MRSALHWSAALLAAFALATCAKGKNTLLAETSAGAEATDPQPEDLAIADPLVASLPAGQYTLDKAHSTLLFKVSHLGFSEYTGRFETFDATLDLDPMSPSAATLQVSIDPASIAVPAPPEGFLDSLRSDRWLEVARYPQMSFKSVRVELTTRDTAKVLGDFTLHGVTRPVLLNVKFNGGYPNHPMDPRARIGFSATTKFNRSDFGLGYGVPQSGSKAGVGDEVDVIIEAEFNGPASIEASKPAAASPGGN